MASDKTSLLLQASYSLSHREDINEIREEIVRLKERIERLLAPPITPIPNPADLHIGWQRTIFFEFPGALAHYVGQSQVFHQMWAVNIQLVPGAAYHFAFRGAGIFCSDVSVSMMQVTIQSGGVALLTTSFPFSGSPNWAGVIDGECFYLHNPADAQQMVTVSFFQRNVANHQVQFSNPQSFFSASYARLPHWH